VFYLHATVYKATTFKISQSENALQGLTLKQFNFVYFPDSPLWDLPDTDP